MRATVRHAPRGSFRYPSRVDADQPSPYEVYCQRCRVSFPIGTRTCIHCGQRIGRARPMPPAPTRPGGTLRRPAGAARQPAGAPPPVFDEADEDELPTRGGLSPIALLWVALILGGAIYRACS
jgi:hypothetical protein